MLLHIPMETEGSDQHPSTVNPSFSASFTDPSIRWAARRMSFRRPDADQANAEKDPQMPPPSPALPVKQSSIGKKRDRGQASAATSTKGGDSPASSGSVHDRFDLRSKGAVDGETGAKKAAQEAMFSAQLTEDEIVADFVAMTGKKPPRRPKRLPKKTREYLAGIVPGSGLPRSITAKRYAVRR